jgi:hypothetical protein
MFRPFKQSSLRCDFCNDVNVDVYVHVGTVYVPVGTVYVHVGTVFVPVGTVYVHVGTVISVPT